MIPSLLLAFKPDDRFEDMVADIVEARCPGVTEWKVSDISVRPKNVEELRVNSTQLCYSGPKRIYARVRGKIRVIAFDMKAYADGYTFARDLDRGSVLIPSDLIPAKVLVKGRRHNNYLTHAEGYVTRVPVKKSTPALAHMVRKIDLVKRGGRVTAVFRRGSVVITMAAVAKGNGSMSQSVYVQNPISRKIFIATVTGKDEVSVGGAR